MTEDQTSDTGDEVERRDYAALVDSLNDALDVRGGLAGTVDIAHYATMSSHIASLLDLEAGLEAALARMGALAKLEYQEYYDSEAGANREIVTERLTHVSAGPAGERQVGLSPLNPNDEDDATKFAAVGTDSLLTIPFLRTRSHEDTFAIAQASPTVQRRRLRVELKRAREAAHLAQAEVARAMDWSQSKLIRIERGDVSVSINDVRALLSHYGVEDSERVDRLIELARSARGGSVYDQYAELLKPGFKEYFAYEATAAIIRQYEQAAIPELLQTEEYSRAILLAAGWAPDEVDKLWTVLQNRQDALYRESPAKMWFTLDEAALRRLVGRPLVMRHQLERLRDLFTEPHISIQIIPFAHGVHPGMTESFVMLDFADSNLDDMVFREIAEQKIMFDDYDSIARYRDRFTLLTQVALPPIDSASFLDAQISTMR